MVYLILVPLLGMIVYGALTNKGKVFFHIILWSIITVLYSFLIWIWLVLLDGMFWVQWFFGFAVIASILPGIAILALGLFTTKIERGDYL